jgi:dTDP-glucose 4,6-dehydratase
MNPVLVTGGAGFIGSNFITRWLKCEGTTILNLDKLTYAGNLANLASVADDPRHVFVRGDINDGDLVRSLLKSHSPSAIVHFAAESHVDRSIHNADEFIRTNILGTFTLLEEARAYWTTLPGSEKSSFRFVQVSTDEVFGSLGPDDPAFSEVTPYAPNSPYSASKASADHLVRSFHHTHGLPTLTSNCSNNYGPYQFPEKLIPLMIHNAVNGKPLPVYGDGLNVRDWLYVEDHCDAIRQILKKGVPGQTYNVGGNHEQTNIDIVRGICSILGELRPGFAYESLITYVNDRPGHDRRYAIDSSKIQREIGWRPSESFRSGMLKTVQWYLENENWVSSITTGAYREWIALSYQSALSVKA